MEVDNTCNYDDNSARNEHIPVSKLRIIKNLLILSLGFFFLYSAYMALENLQSTMNNAGSVGVVSQSVIYGALIISSLFLPKLLIKRFGCKWILIVSTLTYSPYIAANLYPSMLTLVPTAVLLGAGGANLWISADAYINELSYMDSKGDAAKVVLSTSRFFGIFQMFFQTTQIWGNLVSFYVLSPTYITSEIDQNMTIHGGSKLYFDNISCGADFCGGIDKKLTLLPDSKRSILVGIFFSFSIIAAVILLLFLDPLEHKYKGNNDDGFLLKLVATFNQMKRTEQLLLVVLTTFVGLEQGFVFADYTEAYVACVLGLQNVGLVFVCFGIVNAFTAVVVGRLLIYVPRTVMMIAAAVSNMAVCIALLYWNPNIQQIAVFYILISFWGFSDAIWQTQLIAFYGVLFRKDEEAAFASYRLWEALGFLIAYSCSSHLCTTFKIYMQIVILTVGMAGYIALELRMSMKNGNYYQ